MMYLGRGCKRWKPATRWKRFAAPEFMSPQDGRELMRFMLEGLELIPDT
jgi:hypothetical protein